MTIYVRENSYHLDVLREIQVFKVSALDLKSISFESDNFL
jgi:hypothetical protein